MTEIEKNSLKTQATLMKDIIQNFQSINHHIEENGKEIIKLLATKKHDEENKEVILSRENFDKLVDIAYNLGDRNKWYKLGILAQQAIPDNKTKLEILNQLRG